MIAADLRGGGLFVRRSGRWSVAVGPRSRPDGVPSGSLAFPQGGAVFRLSRKFLFFSALATIVCVLGAFGYAQSAQQKATSIVTADDFNQFSWRWVGPMAFEGRVSGLAVPKGQSQTYYVLTATGGIRKTVDAGIHFEPIFEHYGTRPWAGWRSRPPTRTSCISAPASRCTRAPARTVTGCGSRPTPARPGRTSASRRATSSRWSPSTRRTPTSSTRPPRASSTTTRWIASAGCSSRPTAARPGPTWAR